MVGSTGFRFRHKKGQALSFDALLAALLALVIVYFGFSAAAVAGERAAIAEADSAREGRVIAFADYLMKEGLVHKERSEFGAVSYSHVLERGKVAGMGAEGFYVGFGDRCAPLPNRTCICRPTIAFETGEVGFLEACGE